VVGAGPYGLAVAAQLLEAGTDVRAFGEPMAFWERQMPAGMLLRSPREASHIGDPGGRWSLDRYEESIGVPPVRPVPLERFVAYGRWVQENAVPDLDRRRVLCVARGPGGFRLDLEDGGVVTARRVVVAGGIASFAQRPPEFEGLPEELVSHASEHRDLTVFRGRRVLVVGGGQSAIESAALLREARAEVEVLVRAERVHWLVRSGRLHRLQWLRKLLYAPADIGPAGLSWLVASPRWFKRLPVGKQISLARRSIRPAASGWLVPRVAGVRIDLGCEIAAARPAAGGIEVTLADGERRRADHVLLGTGYRVDVARLELLAPELASALALVDGHPVLDRSFESSVPGLHFVGAPAAWSFGPLMRFVAGTGFAARAVARALAP
jgi:cation diffusion facilitator CzcD-associated flavoprotein CzcO